LLRQHVVYVHGLHEAEARYQQHTEHRRVLLEAVIGGLSWLHIPKD
jgi:hypothetical protein